AVRRGDGRAGHALAWDSAGRRRAADGGALRRQGHLQPRPAGRHAVRGAPRARADRCRGVPVHRRPGLAAEAGRGQRRPSAARGWLWLVGGLVFAALLGIGGVAGLVLSGPDDRQRRLAQLTKYRIAAQPGAAANGEVRSPLARAALSWTDRLITARGIQQAV